MDNAAHLSEPVLCGIELSVFCKVVRRFFLCPCQFIKEHVALVCHAKY